MQNTTGDLESLPIISISIFRAFLITCASEVVQILRHYDFRANQSSRFIFLLPYKPIPFPWAVTGSTAWRLSPCSCITLNSHVLFLLTKWRYCSIVISGSTSLCLFSPSFDSLSGSSLFYQLTVGSTLSKVTCWISYGFLLLFSADRLE